MAAPVAVLIAVPVCFRCSCRCRVYAVASACTTVRVRHILPAALSGEPPVIVPPLFLTPGPLSRDDPFYPIRRLINLEITMPSLMFYYSVRACVRSCRFHRAQPPSYSCFRFGLYRCFVFFFMWRRCRILRRFHLGLLHSDYFTT